MSLRTGLLQRGGRTTFLAAQALTVRSAGAAAGIVLLWTVVVTPVLTYIAPQFRGGLLAAYRLFPDASTLTLTHLHALYDPESTPTVTVPITKAAILLIVYAAVLFVLPIILNRRRDAR